MKKCSSRQH